jgi:hypothetical protein
MSKSSTSWAISRRIVGGVRIPISEDNFLYSAFLDFALQYNISNENRLTLVDILIEKE